MYKEWYKLKLTNSLFTEEIESIFTMKRSPLTLVRHRRTIFIFTHLTI